MKNKLFVGAAVVATVLALASCKSTTEDYSTCRTDSEIDASLKASIGFPDAETGVLLDKTEKTGTEYYDIYVAADAKASLFVHQYDASKYFASEEATRNQYLSYSALTFANPDKDYSIYDSEKTAIMSAFYAEDNGITDCLGTTGYTLLTSTDYAKTISSKDAYKAASDGTKVSLAIVYMPTYVIHYKSSQKVLLAHMLIPVYATFVTEAGKEVTADGLVDSKISAIRTVDLTEYAKGATAIGTINNTLATE